MASLANKIKSLAGLIKKTNNTASSLRTTLNSIAGGQKLSDTQIIQKQTAATSAAQQKKKLAEQTLQTVKKETAVQKVECEKKIKELNVKKERLEKINNVLKDKLIIIYATESIGDYYRPDYISGPEIVWVDDHYEFSGGTKKMRYLGTQWIGNQPLAPPMQTIYAGDGQFIFHRLHMGYDTTRKDYLSFDFQDENGGYVSFRNSNPPSDYTLHAYVQYAVNDKTPADLRGKVVEDMVIGSDFKTYKDTFVQLWGSSMRTGAPHNKYGSGLGVVIGGRVLASGNAASLFNYAKGCSWGLDSGLTLTINQATGSINYTGSLLMKDAFILDIEEARNFSFSATFDYGNWEFTPPTTLLLPQEGDFDYRDPEDFITGGEFDSEAYDKWVDSLVIMNSVTINKKG